MKHSLIKGLFFLVSFSIVAFMAYSFVSHTNESDEAGKEYDENSISDSGDQKVFVMVYPISHSFFEATTRGAEEAAEEGNHLLKIYSPDAFDVARQVEIMESLIEEGVDGIGIGAIDSIALKPSIDSAIEAGIPVITFDTDSPLSNRISFVGTDNKLQGLETGRVVAEILDFKGKVLVSMGVPSQLNLRLRLEGLLESLSEYPEIEVVEVQSGNGNAEETSQNIEAMIDSHPDFDLLVGIDAQAGPSAVPIWKDRGLGNKYLVVPEDMPITIEGVRDGIVTACIVQEQYEWGKLVIDKLDQASEGQKILPKYATGINVIDGSNVDNLYPVE